MKTLCLFISCTGTDALPLLAKEEKLKKDFSEHNFVENKTTEGERNEMNDQIEEEPKTLTGVIDR